MKTNIYSITIRYTVDRVVVRLRKHRHDIDVIGIEKDFEDPEDIKEFALGFDIRGFPTTGGFMMGLSHCLRGMGEQIFEEELLNDNS